MDLKERFDEALAGGPAHPPVEARLALGRRAVRRRRTAMGAVALAAALVAGGLGWAVAPGDDPAERTPVASASPSSMPVTPLTPVVPEGTQYDTREVPLDELRLGSGRDAYSWGALDETTLLLAPGVEAVEVVDNPMRFPLPRHSVGVVLRDSSGEERWGLYTWDSTSTFRSEEVPGEAFATFEDWLAHQVAFQTGGGAEVLVRFAVGESTLVGREGVTVVEQVARPDLPPSFTGRAGGGDRWAAARVEYLGREHWVLAREQDGVEEVFPVAFPVEGRPASMAGFLAEARAAIESGRVDR